MSAMREYVAPFLVFMVVLGMFASIGVVVTPDMPLPQRVAWVCVIAVVDITLVLVVDRLLFAGGGR